VGIKPLTDTFEEKFKRGGARLAQRAKLLLASLPKINNAFG
jgi:hypothetical protein